MSTSTNVVGSGTATVQIPDWLPSWSSGLAKQQFIYAVVEAVPRVVATVAELMYTNQTFYAPDLD